MSSTGAAPMNEGGGAAEEGRFVEIEEGFMQLPRASPVLGFSLREAERLAEPLVKG